MLATIPLYIIVLRIPSSIHVCIKRSSSVVLLSAATVPQADECLGDLLALPHQGLPQISHRLRSVRAPLEALTAAPRGVNKSPDEGLGDLLQAPGPASDQPQTVEEVYIVLAMRRPSFSHACSMSAFVSLDEADLKLILLFVAFLSSRVSCVANS